MRKILTVILLAITGLIMAANSESDLVDPLPDKNPDFDLDALLFDETSFIDLLTDEDATMSYALLRCNDSDFIKLIETKVIANAKKIWRPFFEKLKFPLSVLDSISFVLQDKIYKTDTFNGLNIRTELEQSWMACQFTSYAKVCVLPMGPTGTNYLFVLCDTLPDVFIETDDSITIEATCSFGFELDEPGSFIVHKQDNAWQVKWLKYYVDKYGVDADTFDCR